MAYFDGGAGFTIRGLCGAPEDMTDLGDIYRVIDTGEALPCKYVVQTMWVSSVNGDQILVIFHCIPTFLRVPGFRW